MNTKEQNYWTLKTCEPFFSMIRTGEKRIDVRRNLKNKVKVGDIIEFRGFDESCEKSLSFIEVRQVDFIIKTNEPSFWKHIYEENPKETVWSIIQLKPFQCPVCMHVMDHIIDIDNGLDVSYLSCGVSNCQCDCQEHLDYTYKGVLN